MHIEEPPVVHFVAAYGSVLGVIIAVPVVPIVFISPDFVRFRALYIVGYILPAVQAGRSGGAAGVFPLSLGKP